MSRVSQDSIETFISITGASEAVAIQKLEEHCGDLNEAVNAHFNEGDRTNAQAGSHPAPQDDFMNLDDDPIDVDISLPQHPLLSAAHNLNPYALMNSSLGQRIFDGGPTQLSNSMPRVTHPREVREVPIEFRDGNGCPGSSNRGPIIEEVTGIEHAVGPDTYGNPVIVDDDEDLPSAPVDVTFVRNTTTVSPLAGMSDNNNDIEEEMIRVAIEASKRDAKASASQQFNSSEGSSVPKHLPVVEDADLAHAVSLSLKTAEQEKALRKLGSLSRERSSNSLGTDMEDMESVPPAYGRQQKFLCWILGTWRRYLTNARQGPVTHTEIPGKSIIEEGNSSIQEEADVHEQPLVRHRSRCIASEHAESANVVPSPSPSPDVHDVGHRPNGDGFQSNEWGGISSEEHDEAVMLEAAMFGGIPEEGAYNFAYPQPHLQRGYQNSHFYPPPPRPPSPLLTVQRLLREQQDDEYLAALQADREKELKAEQEAERRHLEEAAARQAALEEEKQREEEAHRNKMEEEEFERKLAAKQASLPQEPTLDDENAVTLLVRMPDGSRCGRRFFKSDKLQSLFDYIDVGRVVKPGSYRLVRPYPRRAFSDGETTLSLSELGLTSKQEALFLELI